MYKREKTSAKEGTSKQEKRNHYDVEIEKGLSLVRGYALRGAPGKGKSRGGCGVGVEG